MAQVRRSLLRADRLEDREVPAVFAVAPTGDDANPGSADRPWRTLQAAADRVGAGDTVVVRPGTYRGFNLTASGTAAARITFAADPGVTIDAPNPVTNRDGINLEGASYVTVEGFRVVNQPRAGIRSVVNRHVTIRGNTADANQLWGVFTGFSDDLLVENNVTTRSKEQHGIYVSNSGDRPVVRGNVTWGNDDCGVHMNGDAEVGGDGIITGAVVENNVAYDNGRGGGSGINGDGLQGAVIRNNLVYNTHASGISLFRQNGGGPSSGNLVVNNTVLVSAAGRWALNIQDGSTGNTVRNNILFSAQSFRGAVAVSADSLPGLVSNFNAVEDRFSADGGYSAVGLAGWRAQTGQDGQSFAVANPAALFVNAAGGDYHLWADSPAVDKGTATGAPGTDAEGTARPQGAGVDIGHDELAAAAPAVAGVAVNGGAGQRSRVTELAVTFSGQVALAAGAFTLTRQADGAALSDGGPAPQVAVATRIEAGRTVATLTFVPAPGTALVEAGSLADGVWVLRVDRARVSAGGAPMAADYATPAAGAGRVHRLFGDADGDGAVTNADAFAFGRAFGRAAGQSGYRADFDFDGDGAVTNADAFQFGRRFGRRV